MKKMAIVITLFLLPVFCFSADTKNPVSAKKEAPKPVVPQVKSSEVMVDDFEAEKTAWTGATFMGDNSGMEQTAEDKIVLELNGKVFKSGKKSLRLEYGQNPPKENKFAQISAGSGDKAMGENNAVTFFVNTEKGKAAITVSIFDKSWNKWVSQSITVEKKEWVAVTLKDSDFVTTSKGKWQDACKVQIIVRGAGVFYFDNIKFIKAVK